MTGRHFFQALPWLGKLDKYPHLRTEVNLSALKLLSNVIGKITIIGIVKIMIFFDQNEWGPHNRAIIGSI